ncbi:MAG: cytochrome c peroxidase [Isosphaeraceae bacterium]
MLPFRLAWAGIAGLAAFAVPAGASQARTQKPADRPPVFDSRAASATLKDDAGKPTDYLWEFGDESLIEDEPLAVEVPPGHAQSFFNIAVPASNPITKGKYELGRQLFFDTRVSKDNTVSCATCHNPERGWADGLPASIGIGSQIGGRSAPTVLNMVYAKSLFWDGRAPSLEGQCQGPPTNPIEMGEQAHRDIIERLRAIPGYREQFRKVFGTNVTLDGFAKAIATFERVAALSGDSAYDKYVAGNYKALDDAQKRGMVLFGLRLESNDPDRSKFADVPLKKAQCSSCHVGFNFTDDKFHNLGVGWDEKRKTFADLGRWTIETVGHKANASLGAFRTPTLRDIAKTAPYMHDGSEATLAAVVDYYDKGGNANPYLDKDMKKLNLTSQEKLDLVAFMNALTGAVRPVELPKLPPGPDGTAPDPRKGLTVSAAAKAASGKEVHTKEEKP